MKKNILCIVFTILMISCSTDSESNPSEYIDTLKEANTISVVPENKANPFDFKGSLYYNALILYRENKRAPNSITTITEQIQFISGKFNSASKTSKNLLVFDDQIVQSIMHDPDNIMINIVQGSSLATSVKSNLTSFLQNLILHRHDEFDVICSYIISYENVVLENGVLTEDEKDTILTITSISRYSLYSETQRKDRDWETSVGSKISRPFFLCNEVSIISIIALLKVLI